MKSENEATARAYKHLHTKAEEIPKTLKRLSEAAELLVAYGWFEENNVERFSRHERLDMVRDAIGEAAQTWGIPATERALCALETRVPWFVSGWDHDVPELLKRWQEQLSQEDD
ncbi:MAG: hypothetical protein WA021_00540 [Minisyncoccia bacterium]